MSSRALRKLQENQQNVSKVVENGDSERVDLVVHTSTEGLGGARSKMFNPFDLLNSGSCSESEVKEDDDLGTESSRSRGGAPGQRPAARNKKKRKVKNRKRAGGKLPSSEDNLEELDDEVERSVIEVNRLLGATDETTPAGRRSKRTSEHDASNHLLSIEPKHLNPDNEMKKIFGSRVVLAEQRNHHNVKRGSGGRARPHSRHQWLIVPKPSWPSPGKTGLNMRFLESDDQGNQHFAFEHFQSYQTIQRKFYQAVESMDPDYIVKILNSNPFHIDSLLQLSEICKMGEDVQMATELIERALYAMEAAFHPLFNLTAGTCRLDYRRQENRAFFLALFHHMMHVGSKACYRTALELGKLILSLDPSEDPLAILLVIDFYALRSNQHRWLIDLYDEWEPTKNLSQLPNFAYSVALAKFRHANQKEHKEEAEKEKMLEESDECLRAALTMFPGVLLPLLDKCSIEPDKRAAGHSYFLEPTSNSSQGLEILTSLYVGRSYHIWKEPHVLPWLERNVNAVLDVVDAGGSEFVADCVQKRKLRYQGTPRNVHRHAIVSEIKDATSALPRDLSENPILSCDPLPPTDSIDTYSIAGDGLAGGASDASNAFRMFFASLLPNFDPNAPVGQRAEAEDGGNPGGAAGGAGRPGDLRSSVSTLLDAMHELLGGLHLPELPNDGASSADSENDDED